MASHRSHHAAGWSEAPRQARTASGSTTSPTTTRSDWCATCCASSCACDARASSELAADGVHLQRDVLVVADGLARRELHVDATAAHGVAVVVVAQLPAGGPRVEHNGRA